MPCLKCENGLWKFGKTGKCEYQTKMECEKSNAGYYNKDVYKYEFTQSQMESLHKDGEVFIDIEEDGKEMVLHFVYNIDEVMDIVKESDIFTKKYKNYLAKQYGIKRT